MFPCFKNCISSNVFAWKYDPNRSQGERSGKRRKTNVGRSFRGEEETHRSISVLLVKLANVRKPMQCSDIVCVFLTLSPACVCVCVLDPVSCVCVPWPCLHGPREKNSCKKCRGSHSMGTVWVFYGPFGQTFLLLGSSDITYKQMTTSWPSQEIIFSTRS